HQAVLVGTSMMPSIGQQLWSDRGTSAQTLLPPLFIDLVMPPALQVLAPSPRRAGRLAGDMGVIGLLAALFVSPSHGAEQGQPPDVMYLSAMGQLARARGDHNETVERVHPGPRTPAPVPAVAARPSVRRN